MIAAPRRLHARLHFRLLAASGSRVAAGVGALIFLVSCGAPTREEDLSVEGAEPEPAPMTVEKLGLPEPGFGPSLFERVEPDRSGLPRAGSGASGDSVQGEGPHHGGLLAVGGVAIGDADGDGRDDLFLVDGPGPNRLFRQTGPLRFEDVTGQAGVGGGEAWGTGAAWGDLDGDGDLDLYVCNAGSANQVFVNDGKGRFTENAAAAGVDVVSASLMPALGDYDGDGDLDLYLVTNRYHFPGGMPEDPVALVEGQAIIKPEYARYFGVRMAQGGGENESPAYEVVPVGQRDLLFRNRGDGTFENVTASAGQLAMSPSRGTSALWFDLDGDEDLDLYLTHEGDEGIQAFRNEGGGTFREATAAFFPFTVWSSRGSAVHDVNGDGVLDLLTLAGSPEEDEESAAPERAPWRRGQSALPPIRRSVLWENTGWDRFREVAHSRDLMPSSSAWAAALGDYDHDGLADVVLAGETGLEAWRGVAEGRGRGKGLRFVAVSGEWGLDSVRPARVLVRSDLDADGDLDLVVRTANGGVDLYRNNGLSGDRLVVDLVSRVSSRPPVGARVRVEWEDQSLTSGIYPGAGLLAGQGSHLSLAVPRAKKFKRLVVRWPSGVWQDFKEVPVNSRVTLVEPETGPEPIGERLHPWFWTSDAGAGVRHRESLAGPGPSESPGSVRGPGMACADLNGDGLDDVYLGGAAGSPGRLHLRELTGFREGVSEPFQDHAESEDIGAIFADLDADGYLDLFVVSGGGEAPPGSESYRDRLYLGNGRGGFTHAPDLLPDLRDHGGPVTAGDLDRDGDLDLFVGATGSAGAPGTSRLLINQYPVGGSTRFAASDWTVTGRVTGAVFSDMDADGWVDLLVLDEVRGLRVFHNREGKLVERSLGVEMPSGRWSALIPHDMDVNAAVDYTVTNLAGKSGVFKNDGAGQFTWVEFPEEMEWYPARNACWLDGDGDGRQDLFVVQNLPLVGEWTPQHGGGVGQVFRGRPRERWEPLPPRQTGFVVSGSPTALALTELNGDGAPDFLVARNGASAAALVRSDSSVNWLGVRVFGSLRNVGGIGARVTVHWSGQLVMFAELSVGSGYLSQNANRIFYARPPGPGQGTVTVHWPDDTESEAKFSEVEGIVQVRYRHRR